MAELLLEDRLRAFGEALVFPDEDSLADDVLAALDDPPARSPWKRPLLVAAAIVLLVIGAVLAVPGSRRTVARWLGFDELRIERIELVPPTVTVAPAGLTLDEAAARAGVRPLIAPELGDPISIEAPLGRYVIVQYEEAAVATLPGTLDEGSFGKLLEAGAEVTALDVTGEPAYWITGGPHFFLYLDDEGEMQEARPSADTLVWQRGDTIIRVEGDITLDRATEIAESLREP